MPVVLAPLQQPPPLRPLPPFSDLISTLCYPPGVLTICPAALLCCAVQAICIGVGVAISLAPSPAGVTPKAW